MYCALQAVEMAITSLYVWAVFLPAAVLTGLLVLPMPSVVSKRVGRLVDRILWHPVPFLVSTFPLFMLALCASALAFAWASAGLARRTAALSSATRHGGSNLMDLKALNFRAERNWWISLFALCLYALLYRVRSILHELTRAREIADSAKADLLHAQAELRESSDKLMRYRQRAGSVGGVGVGDRSTSSMQRPAPAPVDLPLPSQVDGNQEGGRSVAPAAETHSDPSTRGTVPKDSLSSPASPARPPMEGVDGGVVEGGMVNDEDTRPIIRGLQGGTGSSSVVKAQYSSVEGLRQRGSSSGGGKGGSTPGLALLSASSGSTVGQSSAEMAH